MNSTAAEIIWYVGIDLYIEWYLLEMVFVYGDNITAKEV